MNPKKFFYILLGSAAILLGIGCYGYYYALTTVKQTSEKMVAQKAVDANADQEIESLTKIQNQYKREIIPILPLIDAALPRTKNQTELLVQLQSIATQSGLTLSNVAFTNAVGLPNTTSQTIASGSVLALPISFQIQGTYAQLQSFLGKIESLSRFTSVTTLSVTSSGRGRPITYAMTFNAYVKP